MSEVALAIEDPATPDAQWCLGEYFTELSEAFPTGYDPNTDSGFDVSAFQPPNGAMFILRDDGAPIGCGVVHRFDQDRAEVKRMWVAQSHRGRGLASRLLAALETWAAEHGFGRVVLDTNSSLAKAIAMYESKGYVATERYNEGVYCDRWFEKRLSG